MKKTERIYEMLYFLNDKQSFQLYDLMKKFDISKSTALRDIETMEEMGMPIYSKFGRNGCYEILKNRLLSPIHFQLEELQALYFSMLSLKAYENSPFQLSMEQLQQKFQRCLSPSILSQFQKMEQVFQLDKKDQNQNCSFLQDIIKLAMEEVPCCVLYTKKDEQQIYRVQFFQIMASFGQWYGLGYMFEKREVKTFRLDRIKKIDGNTLDTPMKIETLKEWNEKTQKKESAHDFRVFVNEKGADLFRKEQYPSMKLEDSQEGYCIHGYFHPGEEDFIAQYFIQFGDSIKKIESEYLIHTIHAKINNLQLWFKNFS